MDNDIKDTDDISPLSDKDKENKYSYNENEMPLDLNDPFNLHARQKSVYDLPRKQQEAMQQEMFSQMKQLKAHNEAMGYHGYSGYLIKHNSDNIIINDNKNNNNNNNNIIVENIEQKADININYNPNRPLSELLNTSSPNENEDYTDKELINKHSKLSETQNKSSIILSETQELKHKLELVTSSINKIRHDLQQQTNEKNSNSMNTKQLNKLIMYFQNQLTEIQDQIEDAENDIESNIDIKFIKYLEQIKSNKNKIKIMKKQRKDKEKQDQINKQKEQQKVIELQRLQIEQLLNAQSHTPDHTPELDINVNIPKHQLNNVHFPLDNQNQNQLNIKGRNRKGSRAYSMKSGNRNRRNSIQSINANNDNIIYGKPTIESDNDDEMNIININSNNNMSVPGMSTYTGYGNNKRYQQSQGQRSISPNYIEGTYQTMGQIIAQREKPLLSDNAVKIIGGVVIVLAGLYVVSKVFQNRNQRGNMQSKNMAIRRTSRMKYG